MVDDTTRRALDLRLRPARIIHMALLSSVVIYGLVLFLAVGDQPPSDADPIALAPVLAAAALGCLVASFLIRARLLRVARDRVGAELGQAQVPALAGLLQSAWIVGWALLESVALFGFVLGFVSQQPAFMLPFAAVAVAGMLFQRPDVDAALRLWEEPRQAR